MRPTFPILLVVAALAVVPTAQACSHGNVSLGRVVVPVGPLYVVYDDTTCGSCATIWLFEETNGVAGLQAGGCSGLVPHDCWYECSWHPPVVVPDTLIF
jgi:hypothetical protein